MSVIKLNNTHGAAVKNIFGNTASTKSGDFNVNLPTFTYGDFHDTYLADRSSFHAYGNFDDTGEIISLISFYESDDEPAWYLTFSFAQPNQEQSLSAVLDTAIEHNETAGRLKFYSKIHSRIRGSQWSDKNTERYSFIDEYVVPSNGLCFYYYHNLTLFLDQMIPGELVVRCNFLKQEYRTILPLGGNL